METAKIPQKILSRQHEITATFMQEIDKHVADVVAGKVTEMMEIQDIAAIMHIHPTHLSNTIKMTTGNSPCTYFEHRLLEQSKTLLRDRDLPIAEVARRLTYDPSNFTKFFKRFAGVTPKQYREMEFLSLTPTSFA